MTKSAEKGKSETSKEFDFNAKDFNRVRDLIYQKAGISLADSKQEMVYSRLARRLRATGMNSFSIYLDSLETDNSEAEWEAFTNALTTNLTSFFREEHHFPLLAEHVKKIKEPINVWCSASSTGEEPYSIAMTLCEAFGTLKPPVHIIATDIDTNVLATASRGVYNLDRLDKMSPDRAKKFFLRGKGAQDGLVRVRPELRDLITFKQLNLLADVWPINGVFDAIFCRNVMIYFDKPTQGAILKKFVPLMKSDGLLFAGHSENFLYVSDDFKLRGKTVYELASEHEVRSKAVSRHSNKG
ncbi:CheR family methyltransferase [Undibacterium sp. RTI2.1]|uniref:CheR family methyltransferase n=1 Tax=unclassified Undibacterium TaxID=2630295 RepID=UPI002AB5C4BC|nr:MULTISPECIES: CheR family methyltransferase [unclassified Undibacterium]MDY7538005.1 CheR family methyltransferase [Undibacterium sp. 5I1]MEB0032016.1 CheR family methyltransferase [Undibacterium sp. RTI2.1]MEB0117212.1 CheR family methyltransferase [Undibacterium sp. RTI2.2]MEB0231095.1 CheR family methyltransferase [Undibacterium sp. 10I3]MEB0257506.1 CheR family methyltransferase [Undibacterium sp. 5I1]